MADTLLRNSITTLRGRVDSIPPSQVLVSGVWLAQNRFTVSNGVPQLNVGLGVREWLVRPLWSDIQRDPTRILHARMGHLPLEPSDDCLCYFPLAGGKTDTGPSGLHIVQRTADDQGTWGVYEHVPPIATVDGLSRDACCYIFPNRDVPNTQVTSKEIGWDATDSWLLEFQVWLPTGCRVKITYSADADADASPPDDFLFIDVNAETGDLKLYWDDRTGTSGHANLSTVSNVISANRWHHVAMQKNTGSDDVRVYLDGVLIVTQA